MAAWYTNSVGWTAVTPWAALTAYNIGDLRRQLATPTVGNERVFRCTTAGTSLAAEPTWTVTKGGTTTEVAGPVWTEVTGSSTYNWNAPHARLANAFAWGAAGDTFYVGHNHAETQASQLTLTGSSTITSPFIVLCVNAAGTVPPVSADLRATATITTTGANPMTIVPSALYHGIIFSGGSGATVNGITIHSGTGALYFDQCSLKKGGTSASTTGINIAPTMTASHRCILDNTTLGFGNTGDRIAIRGNGFFWRNTVSALAGAVFPTTLFSSASAQAAIIELEGVDLSALGSGATIVGAIGVPQRYYLKDCKLGASVTVAAAQADPGSAEVYVTNADSSGTNYRHEKYSYAAMQTIETTIVRTGGASIKGTSIAWKVVTTASVSWIFPFRCLPIVIPDNSIIGTPITVTIQGIWGGGAVPLNDEIWMEAECFGDASSPQGSFTTSGKADILAAGANLTAGVGTWGGSTTKFQMSGSISPQLKGPIYLYVKVAKASSTFYLDPLPVVS